MERHQRLLCARPVLPGRHVAAVGLLHGARLHAGETPFGKIRELPSRFLFNREGDLVKKGQLLFEIDPRTFEAAVDEAAGIRAQKVARLETTSANLARIKPLAEKNAVSQKDLDDATGAFQSAKAELEAADANLKTAKLNLGFTKITSPITGIAGIAKAQIGDLLSPSGGELTTVSSVDPIKVYFNISEQEYLKVATAADAVRFRR
mgnify:CR=1 FL=1